MTSLPFDPHRFLQAQEPVFSTVRSELQAGRKTTHWMWFIFPQLRALGRSGTARFYGLEDRAEAAAYAAHPVLGARLLECAELVLHTPDRSAHQIFGSPDDLKLCSCMTLFEQAAPHPVFTGVLERFYGGERDGLTLQLLST